jgi:hypothetical protein
MSIPNRSDFNHGRLDPFSACGKMIGTWFTIGYSCAAPRSRNISTMTWARASA